MGVRKPRLDEWFTMYLGRKIRSRHWFVPIFIEVDITDLDQSYRLRGRPVPYTAHLLRAVGKMASRCPEINRMVFWSAWGPRLVDFDYVGIALPIAVPGPDGHVRIVRIEQPQERSVAEIRNEIRKQKAPEMRAKSPLRDALGNKNTFLNRLLLRGLYHLYSQFPRLYLRARGPGICVSSNLEFSDAVALPSQGVGFSPMGLTVTASSVVESPDGRKKMRLGLGWDHFIGSMAELGQAVRVLSSALEQERAEA